MSSDFDKMIDAKGLKCPQPLLLVKQAMSSMNSNEILKLEATDPHTDLDLEVWCDRFGHQLLLSDQNSDTFIFYIKKQ